MARSLALSAAALIALGCNIEPYHLSFPGGDGGAPGFPDARRPGDGGPTLVDARTIPDAAGPDGLRPNCVPQPEVCNGVDDDCDYLVDEDFDLTRDPRNCGGCGNACTRPNEYGTCANSTCSFVCFPGFHDLDGKPENGCEYACIETNNGVEICDGVDNNCDGRIDEGFNLTSDPNNCGTCGRVCYALHATPTCVAGPGPGDPPGRVAHCDYDRVKGCDPPYTDISPDIIGCEYLCQVSPPAATDDTCDNIDNDCDGQIDEDVPVGAPCGSDVGECSPGVTKCVAGAIICADAVGPQAEICDGKDNNCNGQIDEGYDKTSDPRHCGPTCAVCQLANAVAKCVPGASGLGECAIAVCLPGFVDLDKNPANGCELACVITGSEVCDGKDNDCNGKIDDGLTPPTGICVERGLCAGTVPVCAMGPPGCDQAVAWRCQYPATAEKDACGNLLPQELLCDGLDGDCDGTPDDSFPNLGQLCGDDKIGICQSKGTYVCKADHTGTECHITQVGQSPVLCNGVPCDPHCDGIDEDCDGQIDEDAVDQTVVVGTGASAFRIDVYEESRPDATGTNVGIMEHRPCSEPNRLPWTNVTETRAAALCALAGKRLCTLAEWEQACSAGTAYPYGDTYQPATCNGADRLDGPNDVVVATGSLPGCTTPAAPKVYDMSGNLKEWTSEDLGGGLFRIMGGAFDSVAPGLTCDFEFVAADGDTYQFDNLGFRCCDAP